MKPSEKRRLKVIGSRNIGESRDLDMDDTPTLSHMPNVLYETLSLIGSRQLQEFG